tara:strand:+ start:1288 stop:2013 length:726 start_codon:yes stop_codon:yes gene_type:complete
MILPVKYSILFYTASFGNDYKVITSDWCKSLDKTLIKPLNKINHHKYNASHIVLSDSYNINNCNVINLNIKRTKHIDSKRQIRIKLLKMFSFPIKEHQRFMWLDVDIRPTPHSVIVIQQILSLPIHLQKGIALTHTQNREKHRFNGGLFMYAGRKCINYWKYLILKNMTFDTRGRVQPYLKEASLSKHCVVTVLPDNTQGFVNSLSKSKKSLSKNYAFIHFTGITKKSPILMETIHLLRYY